MRQITVVTVLFIILYGLAIYFWSVRINWRLNNKFSKWLTYLHYTLTGLLIIEGLLTIIDDISFSGQWTSRVVIVGFLLSGVIIYPFSNWVGKSAIEKNYFRLFSFSPILTAGIFMIPSLGRVLLLSLFGLLTEPVQNIYYEDNKLRIQSTFIGVLGPPRLEIFKKKGLFEVRGINFHRNAFGIDSIRVEKSEQEIFVKIYNKLYEQKGALDVDTVRFKRVE